MCPQHRSNKKCAIRRSRASLMWPILHGACLVKQIGHVARRLLVSWIGRCIDARRVLHTKHMIESSRRRRRRPVHDRSGFHTLTIACIALVDLSFTHYSFTHSPPTHIHTNTHAALSSWLKVFNVCVCVSARKCKGLFMFV